jgi:general secretion pathway protein E
MSAAPQPQRLGEWLVARHGVAPGDVDRALAWQRSHGDRLGAILVRLGALSEDTLYAALAAHRGLPLLDAAPAAWDEGAVARALVRSPLSSAQWLRRRAIAWQGSDGALHVAAVDPWDAELRESLDAGGAHVAQWHVMPPARWEGWQAVLQDHGGAKSATPLDSRALRELAEDAPVIAYVNGVLAQAVEARASDIHLEPGEREFELRFRIDGVLHARGTQPMSRYPAVASRVKLVSGLDIAERRLPQDGRTTIRVAGQEMDVRVSSIPAVHGESLVLRLLPKQRGDLQLARLGMEADHLTLFERWLHWPNGLVLVTGPTGSGKSTTLYAALAAVNDLTRKIITVEDPVEFRLPHVVQIQAQAEIGYTFARALRSMLRHDPDIIMIGEIRDRETAEIAVQSALTGHLVVATVHTNDALSAVTRLVDMGIEPYLVAAALRAVMAQRLVRRLCAACAGEAAAPLDARWAASWAKVRAQSGPPRWRHAGACEQCQRTGFRGRLGIYELVEIGEALQHRIASGASIAELQQLADAAGRRSLFEDGLIKCARGHSTIEEVLRACGGMALEGDGSV